METSCSTTAYSPMIAPAAISARGSTRAVDAIWAEGCAGNRSGYQMEHAEQRDPQQPQKVPVEGHRVHKLAPGRAPQQHHQQRDDAADHVRGVQSGEQVEERAVRVLRQERAE